MGVFDGLFGTSHKAMTKDKGNFLTKLLEGIGKPDSNKLQSTNYQHGYKPETNNNNSSGGNPSANSGGNGASYAGKDRNDSMFSTRTNTPVFSYASNASHNSEVIHTVTEYETFVPVYVGADLPHDDPFFHMYNDPAVSQVASDLGGALALDFLLNTDWNDKITPANVAEVAVDVQKTQGSGVMV